MEPMMLRFVLHFVHLYILPSAYVMLTCIRRVPLTLPLQLLHVMLFSRTQLQLAKINDEPLRCVLKRVNFTKCKHQPIRVKYICQLFLSTVLYCPAIRAFNAFRLEQERKNCAHKISGSHSPPIANSFTCNALWAQRRC